MVKFMKKHQRKYLAELIGTFILCMAVNLSLAGAFVVGTPFAAGIALGLCVYTLGGVSGAHFNPAITAGLWSIGKITGKHTGYYIAAQIVGAALAVLFIKHGLKIEPSNLIAANSPKIIGAEFVGAFVFAFGVAAAMHGKISAGASGLAVGGSLLLGIALAAAAGSNAVLNPAVALAIGTYSLSYLIGPIVGAILAMWVYRYLSA